LIRADKEKIINNLSASIAKANAFFMLNYKGLNFMQLSKVRKSIKESGGDYMVVKNRLLKLALQNNSIEFNDNFLKEPTAVAIAYGEPSVVAKSIKNYLKEFKNLDIKCGYLSGDVLSYEDVCELADIPSREELLSMMLGSLNAPITNFVSLMSNIPRSFVNVLNAIKDKKSN